MSSVPPETLDLLDYIDASPSPWHCVTESVRRLHEAGYRGVGESTEHWPVTPGKKLYVVRGGGSLIAWKVGQRLPSDAGFRVVTAHTDSPSLRVKPRPDRHKEGYASLGLETYGSALTATWTDRDLSIAGRVTLRAEGGREAMAQRGARHGKLGSNAVGADLSLKPAAASAGDLLKLSPSKTISVVKAAIRLQLDLEVLYPPTGDDDPGGLSRVTPAQVCEDGGASYFAGRHHRLDREVKFQIKRIQGIRLAP